MRILITGGKGQLGRALAAHLSDHIVFSIDLPEIDITEQARFSATVAETQPEVVLHCAAYTDVNGCARDPALAYRVNGMGTQNVALACAAVGATMLYVSTNEVFDGHASTPYSEFAQPRPANPYGASKLAGEWYTHHLLRRFYIVRTSWLYSASGRNFIHRIQELADEHGKLQVVTDEVAAPTSVDDLAGAIVQLIETGQYGIYHLTNAGAASRFAFAKEVLALTGREHVPVAPITLAEFQRASSPPPYGVLANNMAAALGIRLRPWDEALAALFAS